MRSQLSLGQLGCTSHFTGKYGEFVKGRGEEGILKIF
ncbi:hypothetical protein KCTC52924_01683 [Arenibacter antarcticus]